MLSRRRGGERKSNTLRRDEICLVISAADTHRCEIPQSRGEKTLHHPYQKLIPWKSNKMLHLFSLGEAVTLNSFLRRASIYFASTCLLKPPSGDDDNITAILSMSPSHSGATSLWGHTSTNALWPCWELNLQSYQHWRQTQSDELQWTQEKKKKKKSALLCVRLLPSILQCQLC